MTASSTTPFDAKANWAFTGGCGFVGRNIIAYLIRLGVEPGRIRVLDNFSVGTTADLERVTGHTEMNGRWGGNAVGVIEGDVRNADETSAGLEGADYIIHLAGATGVVPSVKDPKFDCTQNVLGTLHVLETARHQGTKGVVFASSSAPLGMVEPPVHEGLAPNPASPYGASKLAGEAYCQAYANCFDVATVSLRFGNIYGPYSSHKESLVANFIGRAFRGENLEIYGDGTATRDFIHADDLSRAVFMSATNPPRKGAIYHIATHSETTVNEITEKLVGVLHANGIDDFKVVNTQERQGDVKRNFADTTLAREELGWTPEISLDDGLKQTVKWFIDNRQPA